MDFFWGWVVLGLFLILARMIKSRAAWLEALFIPSSIIAGVLVLALGPQGLGRVWRDGLFPDALLDVWRGLPGLLISVVFAALFLGRPIPGVRTIWRRAGPQVVFGQTLAWGQYVVGITLALTVLTPVFGMSPLAGALIEIGFEGGHGTAAGMAQTFRDLDFPAGADLALGLATIGLVGGVICGTILINWAARRGHIRLSADQRLRVRDVRTLSGHDSDIAEELRELQWEREQENRPTDPLSIHIGVIGLAVGIGWLMRMADPGNKSGALESFGYKQLLFEPIVGGGLFTAASMPLIAQLGAPWVLVLTGGITVFWLIIGFALFGRYARTHTLTNPQTRGA